MRIWILAMFATSCAWNAPTPTARVQHGPAFGERPNMLAALPVACVASPDDCTRAHALAVASATRMTLEYDGYSIVDSELVNAEMLRRHERTSARIESPPPAPLSATLATAPPRERPQEVVSGVAWAEASPEQRRELLVSMGVDGLLATTITVGPARGMAFQRTIAVELAVTRLDGRLVWWSQCRAETGDYNSNEEAMERATRCALESATLW